MIDKAKQTLSFLQSCLPFKFITVGTLHLKQTSSLVEAATSYCLGFTHIIDNVYVVHELKKTL